MKKEYSVVGKSLPRVDGLSKVTGQAKFTLDVQLPGMLYGKILRSPHAHARILGIDNILGTLEKGKWASFTGWNGDPFDLTSYPVAVYGEGKLLFSE